jgi:hypothetical protein
MTARRVYDWPTELDAAVLFPYGADTKRDKQQKVLQAAHHVRWYVDNRWYPNTKRADEGILFWWSGDRSQNAAKAQTAYRVNQET